MMVADLILCVLLIGSRIGSGVLMLCSPEKMCLASSACACSLGLQAAHIVRYILTAPHRTETEICAGIYRRCTALSPGLNVQYLTAVLLLDQVDMII